MNLIVPTLNYCISKIICSFDMFCIHSYLSWNCSQSFFQNVLFCNILCCFRINIEDECLRLKEGFMKSLNSKVPQALSDVKGIVSTPEWQRCRFWVASV